MKTIVSQKTLPGYWIPRGGSETTIKLRELVELREESDIELHVEVRKKGNEMKIGNKEYKI